MSYQEQDDILLEQQDELSMNKGFDNKNLQDYLSFKRNKLNLENNKPIQCMKIDISPTVKYIINENGEEQPIPVAKIYAVTKDGNSLQIDVKGFVPYFYTELPRNLPPNQSPQVLQQIRQKINKHYAQVQASKRKKNDRRPPNTNAIKRISYVDKKNIRNYVPDQYAMNKFWKIQTSVPNVINSLRKIFEDQTIIDGLQLPKQTFQSNIPYVLRFMIDKNIVGMGWINIKKYRVVRRQEEEIQVEQQQKQEEKNAKSKPKNSKNTQSKLVPKCQLQIQCEADDESILGMPMKFDMPPIRILSFDIECAAQHGFPDPNKHQIIQIACVCKTSNQSQDDYKVVFVLNGADKISGAHVMSSDDEKDLLINFEKLILTYDPDFITGYNMVNFDLWYILERAQALKMSNYGLFGRSEGVLSKIINGSLQSKIMGNREFKEINIDGRIQLDMYIHMQKEFKFSSYKLNNVAFEILKDQKEDVHHTQIYKLFKQDKTTRKRLAIYCLKDAQLPLRLLDKLCCLYNYTQMARVTGVPINFLLNRGQQIKVMSQLLRKAQQHDYICPTERVKKNDNQIGYQGAYVLDPEVGYYDDPIATLDFASLYPSIMIAHNLCYTTLIRPDLIRHYNIPQDQVTETMDNKVYFVKSSVRQGLLPEILNQLLAARKIAKTLLKSQNDPFMRNVLEGRQLALKISANSVYGFTGALVGQLPCLQISSSVTWFGRHMIENTKNAVIRQFPGAEVIYGDTDSVMVKFKLDQSLNLIQDNKKRRVQKIKASMQKGKDAAEKITNLLFNGMKPIKLQFQKVYCPYLLIAKKRYAGAYYSSNPKQADKIDKKGIESVRRDNCKMIRNMLEEVLKFVLTESDKGGREKAAQYIKDQVSMLVQNKIDISELVISKGISKKTQEQSEQDQNPKKGNKSKSTQNTYKVKQAHVQLAQKMKKRDQNLNIGIGDRISYVMINGQKGSKNYDNAETPLLVLQQDLPIDYDYYINKQIRPPLQRLLGKTGIISNFDSLFCGQHTKNRYIPKIGKSNFFSKFVEKKTTCINCPTVVLTGDLCERCEQKRDQIYLKKEQQICEMKRTYQKMWQQCVNCQGSNFQEVLCKNQDCPIFYRRMKIKKDLQIKNKQMQRCLW